MGRARPPVASGHARSGAAEGGGLRRARLRHRRRDRLPRPGGHPASQRQSSFPRAAHPARGRIRKQRPGRRRCAGPDQEPRSGPHGTARRAGLRRASGRRGAGRALRRRGAAARHPSAGLRLHRPRPETLRAGGGRGIHLPAQPRARGRVSLPAPDAAKGAASQGGRVVSRARSRAAGRASRNGRGEERGRSLLPRGRAGRVRLRLRSGARPGRPGTPAFGPRQDRLSAPVHERRAVRPARTARRLQRSLRRRTERHAYAPVPLCGARQYRAQQRLSGQAQPRAARPECRGGDGAQARRREASLVDLSRPRRDRAFPRTREDVRRFQRGRLRNGHAIRLGRLHLRGSAGPRARLLRPRPDLHGAGKIRGVYRVQHADGPRAHRNSDQAHDRLVRDSLHAARSGAGGRPPDVHCRRPHPRPPDDHERRPDAVLQPPGARPMDGSGGAPERESAAFARAAGAPVRAGHPRVSCQSPCPARRARTGGAGDRPGVSPEPEARRALGRAHGAGLLRDRHARPRPAGLGAAQGKRHSQEGLRQP